MMGIEDEIYAECERKRKIAEEALAILWASYEGIISDPHEGPFMSLRAVKFQAECNVKFAEDFPKGMKHGERCPSTFERLFHADIKCDLPLGHDGTHRGCGTRWETVPGRTSLGQGGSDDD